MRYLKKYFELIQEKLNEEVEDKIKDAIIWLTLRKPTFGEFLTHLNIYADDTIEPPTMQTDGRSIVFHPDFVYEQEIEAIKFVLIHEIYHCYFKHPERGIGKDHTLWNRATDYAINPLIANDSDFGDNLLWPQRDGKDIGLFRDDFVGMSDESIYQILVEETEKYGKPQTPPSREFPNLEPEEIDSVPDEPLKIKKDDIIQLSQELSNKIKEQRNQKKQQQKERQQKERQQKERQQKERQQKERQQKERQQKERQQNQEQQQQNQEQQQQNQEQQQQNQEQQQQNQEQQQQNQEQQKTQTKVANAMVGDIVRVLKDSSYGEIINIKGTDDFEIKPISKEEAIKKLNLIKL